MSITSRGSSFTTTAGNKTVTGTPAVNDLMVIVASNSGRTTANPPTLTDDNSSGTYDRITAVDATKNSSADSLWIFVRTALITSATSTIFTMTQSGDTGGGLVVLSITGVSRLGSAAVRATGKQDNQASGTPACALTQTGLTTSNWVGAVMTASNTTSNVLQPTGWAENFDNGYNTPATGMEVCSQGTGITPSTVTWAGAAASAFCSLAIEIDLTTAAADVGFPFVGGGYYPS